MTAYLRIFLVIVSVGFLFFVLQMVRRNRILLRYSFSWVVLGVLGVLAALFPDAVEAISTSIGFIAPSSFLFLTCIFFLMVVSFVLAAALSRQSNMIVRLVQEVSLLKMQLKDDAEIHEVTESDE